jgi:ABC-type uncharacterized transport system involved in gliding motility auxiliary subunit
MPAIETAPNTNEGPGGAEIQDETEGTNIASDINESESQEITEAGADATAPIDLEGRIVVVGDADWLSNSRLTVMYNEDLALNMVGWLTGGNESTITIRPRARRASRITLTDTQGWGVFYATVLLLPELVLLSGLMIWWRRRR